MIDYSSLGDRTSTAFAEAVQRHIDAQLAVRDVLGVQISEDNGIVQVEYMAGRDGRPHSLWQHWYDVETGATDHSVVDRASVERFLRWGGEDGCKRQL